MVLFVRLQSFFQMNTFPGEGRRIQVTIHWKALVYICRRVGEIHSRVELESLWTPLRFHSWYWPAARRRVVDQGALSCSSQSVVRRYYIPGSSVARSLNVKVSAWMFQRPSREDVGATHVEARVTWLHDLALCVVFDGRQYCRALCMYLACFPHPVDWPLSHACRPISPTRVNSFSAQRLQFFRCSSIVFKIDYLVITQVRRHHTQTFSVGITSSPPLIRTQAQPLAARVWHITADPWTSTRTQIVCPTRQTKFMYFQFNPTPSHANVNRSQRMWPNGGPCLLAFRCILGAPVAR